MIMLSKKITTIYIFLFIALSVIGQNTTSPIVTKLSVNSQINTFDGNPNDATSELRSFSAEINDEKVAINWDMNNINDVLGFELYKSTDGSNWDLIAYVEGDETIDFTFSYTDETPNWGINYYRLRMLNMNGEYGFLKTTKVVFEYTTGAEVGDFFPNPVTNGTANININIPDGGEATIYIHDSMGKLAGTFQKTIESGADTISLDLNDLSYGIYYAKISINRATYVKKIMVRKAR